MDLKRPEDFRVQECAIGAERAPLLVIDSVVSDPEQLVAHAATKHFSTAGRYFPGLRAKAPLSYRAYLAGELADLLSRFFGLRGKTMVFAMCHYSLVTTPPGELVTLQRLPHIDSVEPGGLATIHYLFRGDLGGTAFYRHRASGFEVVDGERRAAYFMALEAECNGGHAPSAAYINGDTPLFEQVARQDGVFNRMLVYRRNSLHSGCIGRDFVPNPDPRTGRLSINSFIDLQ